VVSRRWVEEVGREGEERRAERRRISSMSSVGRGCCCLAACLALARVLVDVDVDGGLRSRDFRPLRMSWVFASWMRALLSAYIDGVSETNRRRWKKGEK
jgi:hypothetical protein